MDKVVEVKLMIGKCLMNVISGYAPQAGRSQVKKGMKEYMEGETVLKFGDAMDMIVCGMQFKKDDNIVTYLLGGLNTTVDCLMIHKQDRECLWDAKAIPGEEAVSQHHLILADMKVRGAVKAQRKKFQPRRKVWRLNDENG